MNSPIVAHRNNPPSRELAIPKTLPARFVAELMTCWAFSWSFWISSCVDRSIPSGLSHAARLSTRLGAFCTSERNPEITAGTIRARSSRTDANRIRKMRPVADPRRQPREASQSTAGSNANERKSAVPSIVRKLLSWSTR